MDYKKFVRDAKDQRKNEVINVAADLFVEKGINDIKMTDVADASGLGIASIYRYFGTKAELVVACSGVLWDKIRTEYFLEYPKPVFSTKSGYEQLKSCLEIFFVLFSTNLGFLKFIFDFDAMLRSENICPVDFSSKLINYSPIFNSALEKGKEDGTIKKDIDCNLFYKTTVNSYFALCEKFVYDREQEKPQYTVEIQKEQLRCLIDFALCYAKA